MNEGKAGRRGGGGGGGEGEKMGGRGAGGDGGAIGAHKGRGGGGCRRWQRTCNVLGFAGGCSEMGWEAELRGKGGGGTAAARCHSAAGEVLCAF